MSMTRTVLAIDQGTTGTTALLLDAAGTVRAKVNREFPQIYPRPGLVEHDPEAIWRSTLEAIAGALEQADSRADAIAAIGITNQRETVLLWEWASGRPIGHAIVWQDRRTADRCAELKAAGQEEWIHRRTGLVLDPYFSATKLEWLLREIAAPRRRELAAGTIDSFLVHRLTAGAAHVTDVSNASRTLLCALETLAWDTELCELFHVPIEILPRIVASSEVYGTTRGVPGLPDGIPIAGMAGDQQAALFGQACFAPGDAKCTYGTGAFVLMNTGARPVFSRAGMLTTVAWKRGEEVAYALEGSAFVAGAMVQWLRDGLGLIRSAAEIEPLAASVPDTGGVIAVPALAGLGAPYWRPEARGIVTGLTRGTTAAHLARAVLEGIALQIVDLVRAMEADAGRTLSALKVDGGASSNDLLMQMQADFLGTEISRPAIVETTALGAAFLAGLGVGLWQSPQALASAWREERRFRPKLDPEEAKRRRERFAEAAAKA